MNNRHNYFITSLVAIGNICQLFSNHDPNYDHPYEISWSSEWMADGFTMKWMPTCGIDDAAFEFEVVCIDDAGNSETAFHPIRCVIRNTKNREYKKEFEAKQYIFMTNEELLAAYDFWKAEEAKIMHKIEDLEKGF